MGREAEIAAYQQKMGPPIYSGEGQADNEQEVSIQSYKQRVSSDCGVVIIYDHPPHELSVIINTNMPRINTLYALNLGALDGGPLCHVSNLRNYNVACHIAIHVSCRL